MWRFVPMPPGALSVTEDGVMKRPELCVIISTSAILRTLLKVTVSKLAHTVSINDDLNSW